MWRTSCILLSFFVLFTSFDKPNRVRIVSYNVENLFDCIDDPLTKDEEFTPSGNRYWTYQKYKKKVVDIAKTVIAIGEWEYPVLVALCEIENELVLKDLTKYSPLKEANYLYVHQNSPDMRGIDVALLYQKENFSLISAEFLKVTNKEQTYRTRDILYAQGCLSSGDTLHVFVNHWPSRLGGELESEEKRILAASVLKKKVIDIQKKHIDPYILIMGDFNDMPNNKSIVETLGATCINTKDKILNENLYNLSCKAHEENIIGTYKLAGEWNVLDQIIVSGCFFNEDASLSIKNNEAIIYLSDFLLEKDEKNLGFRPKRTYQGFKYIGGVSDHLPVYIDLIIK